MVLALVSEVGEVKVFRLRFGRLPRGKELEADLEVGEGLPIGGVDHEAAEGCRG